MRKIQGAVAAICGTLMMAGSMQAMADSTDDIVNALIGKGVLTEEEGALLLKGRAGEKEAVEKEKASEVKMSLKDGIKWESGDKSTSIKLIGRLHADYRTFDHSETDSGTGGSAGADTFDVRRARLGFEGVFNNYYKFKVQTDMAATNKLDEAYLNIAWWKPVQFMFGQFKMPSMLEEMTSSNNIDFMERSMANASVAGKERGAMVHGEPLGGLTYALAVSSGEGQNNSENDVRVDDVDTLARVTANFAQMASLKNMVLHAGVNYSTGDLDQGSDIGYDGRTEARGVTFFNAGGIAAIADDTEIERDRLGLEAALAYGPFKLQSEWTKVGHEFDAAGTTATDDSLDIDTWYAQAVWNITGESWADMYKGGAWGGLKPKNNFNPNGTGWGAWQVGVRYSQFEADEAFGSIGNVGFAEADAWTLGLNFYPNANTRIMVNYVTTDFEQEDSAVAVNGRPVEDERAIITRVQWMF
ncbi:MAG TPA: porin [Methylophilaceae bacterium]|nr:porin [Methylophilaceae bacterium]